MKSNNAPVKMEFFQREFFAISPKKIEVENNEGTGRTYFLHKGRIVAVGEPEGASR